MTWFKDEDGDYINLDKMDFVEVKDYGKGWINPFKIEAVSNDLRYTLGEFKTESGARLKLDEIMASLIVRKK